MAEPDSGKAGLLERLRQRWRTRRQRAAERAIADHQLKRSAAGKRGNKPGAGGGYSGGY